MSVPAPTPTPTPTPAEIVALAEDLGYPTVVDAADDYAAMLAGMLGVYDAVEAVPEQIDPAPRTDVCTACPRPTRIRTTRGWSAPRSPAPRAARCPDSGWG